MAIITTIEQVKEVFSSPNINNEIEFIQSYITDAEQLLEKYISASVLVQLQNYHTTNSTGSAFLNKALLLSQKVVVNYAYYLLSSDGSIMLDDTGFKRMKSEFSDSAYQWQVRDFRALRLLATYKNLDLLLKHYDKNIDLADAFLYKNSDEHKRNKQYFVWNFDIFNQERSCKSFYEVDVLKPSMWDVQQNIIANNIGEDLYQDLLDANLNNDFTDDEKKLLPFIWDAVANLATARAIDEEVILFGPEGIEVKEFKAGGSNDGSQVSKNSGQLATVKKAAQEKGEAAIKRLRKFLNKNAAANKYVSYFNSDLYDDPTDTTSKSTFENKKESSLYFFG